MDLILMCIIFQNNNLYYCLCYANWTLEVYIPTPSARTEYEYLHVGNEFKTIKENF